MKFITLFCALILSVQVQAGEIKLASIASDTTTDVTVFYLETNDDGSAQAMRYVTTAESGRITEDVHSRLDEVLNGGVIVKVMEGREIIRLFLESFDAKAGGIVRLKYLANGVTGSWSSMTIKLDNKAGKFALVSDDGGVANYLFIWGNWSKILRRWIGVNYIEASSQPIRK